MRASLLGVTFCAVWGLGVVPALAQSAPAPKRAMVIVLEENNAQTFSVTWARLAQAMRTTSWANLIPADQRPLLKPIVDAVQGVAGNLGVSTAPFLDALTATTRRALAQRMAQVLDATQNQLGLPATGCARTLVRNVVQRGLQGGEEPFEAFKNVYGEDILAGCLRSMAQPYYDRVDVFTDRQAQFEVFRTRLRELDAANYVIDVLINLHGCGNPQAAASPNRSAECGQTALLFSSPDPAAAGGVRVGPDLMKGIRPTLAEAARSLTRDATSRSRVPSSGQVTTLQPPPPLKLNAVYMVSCWGSNFIEAWQHVGARAVNGSRELNYYVLLSPLVFMDQFTRLDKTLRDASAAAYNAERVLTAPGSFTVGLDIRPAVNAFLNSVPNLAPQAKDTARATIGLACPQQSFNNCRVGVDIGRQYTAIVGSLLGQIYGHQKRPVNAAGSSQRIDAGGATVRRAGR